jgi:hypothetical protein
MMNARARRELMEEMAQEYDMPLIKSLMNTISEQTGITCSQSADIVVTAWQRSKENQVDSECFEQAAALS